MSVADQFAHLRGYQSPEWLENAQDDDSDLVEAARKSLLDAIQVVSPQAALPYQLELRLIGESTKAGKLPTDAMVVAQRFQQEVREVLSTPALRSVEIDWAGVSEGSAVMHLAPRLQAVKDDGGLEAAHVDEFEQAVARVLDVHDRLESEAHDAAFARERPAFLDRVRLLVEALNEQSLNLDVTAYGSQGSVYRSSLAQRGRLRGQELFQRRDRTPTVETISGLVVSVDLEARSCAMRSEEYRGKLEIGDVPDELIRTGVLRAGIEVALRVEVIEATDHVGTQKASRRKWIGFASSQTALEFGDDS